MDRRKFLKTSSAAGALAWLSGTHPLTAQIGSGYHNAVPFVADPTATGLAPAEIESLFQIATRVTPAQQAATYPQSVASGDPRPSGVVLWTRLNPYVLGTPSGSLVAWQISSDSTFLPASLLITGVATISKSRDYTVKIPVSNGVLQPFTGYYYRFIYNGVPSRPGQFKTLPAVTDNLAQLKLGFVVCQDYGNGYYNALHYLAQEPVDYVVHLGDYIYETIRSSVFQTNPVRTVPPFAYEGDVPQNLEDYRHLYRLYHADLNQQAVHERFTYIQLWDDHEFGNDCHQDFHPDNNTSPNSATTPQPALRQAASQAWSEYCLADTPFDSTKNWENSIQVYRSFSFGSLAELIVTDERLYRDGPPCGNNEAFQRYFSVGCGEMSDSSRTMLGVTQRDWFLNQLTTTPSTWKLWANEVMLMQLKLVLIYVNLDQWDGYQQERNLILNTIKDNHIKNVVALTGDLHTFQAGYLKTDFDNPFEPNVGIELMVGSITSANFAEEINSVLPLSSRPLPAKQMGVTPDLLASVVQASNPWIKYWNSSAHGYGILTITPGQMVCQYKAVSTITQPTATLSTLATFTIPVGKVQLNQS